ncbi:type IV pilus modification PilV family protein [Fervidibacillus halotolerans]|uniref:Type II secretion system GspH family protein n=1 Tax=Fervidibacillus halotolerans TaxID=2980027 RepID=A0A9E8M0B0_9BACI|nr:type II secretion system protein [Fervidibacillus halotolerans]WAA12846.1 type II secretion system GspH family protein [Fervidibacillus halotolerans]
MKPSKKGRAGFTLLEVVVAITILSITILTFFQIFMFSQKTANSNNEKIVAIHLAKATLERVKTSPTYYFSVTDAGIQLNEGLEIDEQNRIVEEQMINEKKYIVTIDLTIDDVSGFIHVLVEVRLDGERFVSSKVEGFVQNEKEK